MQPPSGNSTKIWSPGRRNYRALKKLAIALCASAMALSQAGAVAQDAAAPPAQPLEALRAEYAQAMNAWTAKYRGDLKTPAPLLIERYDAWPGWSFAPRIARLGTSDATAPHAFEALKWYVVEFANAVGSADRGYFAYGEPVCQELAARHLANPRIVELFGNCSFNPTPAREALLRACLEKGETRDVRGLACFYLAECLENKGRLAFQLASGQWARDDPFLKHIVDRHAVAFDAYVQLTDCTLALAEMKALEQRVLDEFAEVPALRGHVFAPQKPTLGFMVRLKRAQASAPSIGEQAAELTGPANDGQVRKLSDYCGQVVVLHFWATWNRTSIEKLPQLQNLAKRHAADKLCILGVNCDPDRQAAANFAKNNSLSWPWWLATDLGESIGRYSPGRSLAAVILIDAKGVLRYQDPVGEALDTSVATLLSEQSPEKSAKP